MAYLEQRGPNWLDLPVQFMELILSRLSMIDILESAQMVCRSWYQIFQNPNMWRTVDMRNTDDDNVNHLAMCYKAVRRSRGQLVDINLEYMGDEVNSLLLHVSIRYFSFLLAIFFLLLFVFERN